MNIRAWNNFYLIKKMEFQKDDTFFFKLFFLLLGMDDNSFLFRRGGGKSELVERDLTFVKGYLLLAFTVISFVVIMYMVVIAKFMPDTGNNILDFIKQVRISSIFIITIWK